MDPEAHEEDAYLPSTTSSSSQSPAEVLPASSRRGRSDDNSSSSSSSANTSHKRRRSRSHHTTALITAALAPKRQKGLFNAQYLHLLNAEIAAAAGAGTGIADPLLTGSSSEPKLTPSQLGAVTWSAGEKHAFFAAVARLGPDDAPGIAARIGSSKSELEVRQYLRLLGSQTRTRGRTLRAADVPAAAEIRGADLERALEAAADGVAARQEAHEAGVERRRWGERWRVVTGRGLRQQKRRGHENNENDNDNDDSGEDKTPAFARFFALPRWLALADRVFMNSSVREGNWRHVMAAATDVDESETRAPALRATALADFHALAASVTRRLVAATLFVAESRLRGGRAGRAPRRVVKARDVRAAIASVGMRGDSREFWARAARRLRLDVYDDDGEEEEEEEEETPDKPPAEAAGEDNEEEDEYVETDMDEEAGGQDGYEPDILSYDEVEAALGLQKTSDQEPPSIDDLPDVSSISEDELSDSEEQAEEEEEEDIEMDDANDADIDRDAVERDLEEAIIYSAVDYGGTTRAKEALQKRIKAEHRLEADAESLDARVSAQEEARLWSVLRGESYSTVVKVEEEAPESKPKLKPSRTSGLSHIAPNWRDNLEYQSEWEYGQSAR
ncbi:hypothetical protein F4779DRAFT_640312 [Xylariaceae sp. FL0662B]|nr:hypothetical protein F4779DRAFT_640312 [Xylariaceae sp. FL0662B]